MKKSNFFFFGDSICFGQSISPHKIWITSLSKIIEGKFVNKITVFNISRNGDTTRIALEKMAFDIQSHGVDFILIQFGMNDCNYWLTDKGLPRVSKESFKANLKEMIVRVRNFGAKEVFINTNHPTTRNDLFPHMKKTYQESNEEYNKVIRQVARSSKATLIDIEKEFYRRIKKGRDIKELLLLDKIHLSEHGHSLYTEIISPIIINKIKKYYDY